jgi:hypothetical protein
LQRIAWNEASTSTNNKKGDERLDERAWELARKAGVAMGKAERAERAERVEKGKRKK